MTASLWQMPAEKSSLTPETVHIWRGSLKITPAKLAVYAPLLSLPEQARAKQFRFERDRHRFMLSRGTLRQILGNYLECPPAELVFEYGEFGKPYLVNSPLPQMQFNLSHSGDIALYGLSCDRQIGVDIEVMRPLPRLAQLAQRCLTPSEQAYLYSKAAQQQAEIFLSYWTCKEALLKATGQGLTQAMHQLEIALSPSPSLVPPAAGSATFWRLRQLQLESNYIAAIAVEGTGWQLSCWRHAEAVEFESVG
ncbi:MAG: 4'-phosphopantetheinyl transferase superfamily protein [Leptolyngbyaceae cyanobacterium SM1_1_3]|nr:4'-phosphopantetheinyl transferase superfamily protein [Leptolyngbyaceae cyanobacterium SM1_1_3]NJO10856.1 4'-phosphopantetheinyl transferase superfamily protein [Leptolyngbyaceae cyanobacterium SL_1_1]